MAGPKVFIFAPIDTSGATHRRLEQNGCELVLGDGAWISPTGHTDDELIVIIKDCQAVTGTMMRGASFSRRVMEQCDKLRIIAKYTIGCDDVDTDAATDLGIMVTHGPTESNWGGVAEGTVANMLCVLKKLRERDRHLKTGGEWRLPELTGTYLGSRTEGARADGYPGLTVGSLGASAPELPTCCAPGKCASWPAIPTSRTRISPSTASTRATSKRCCVSPTSSRCTLS